MGNLVIASPDVSDLATVTASAETTAGPATNMQLMQPTDLWESGNTSAYCTIDLGAVTSMNAVALLFTNLSATATARLRTADTEAGLTSAPDYDAYMSQALAIAGDYTHMWEWVEAGISNRWLRIDLSDAANTDSSIMVGRLYASYGIQLTRNYRYGAENGFDDESQFDVTDGKTMIPARAANRPVASFTLTMITEAERHNIRELMRIRGATRDVLIVEDPDTTSNLGDKMHCGFLQARRTVVNNSFNVHQIQLELTGLIG